MHSSWIAIASFACVVGGAAAGHALRRVVPERHLHDDAKNAVKVAAGMLATLTAMVLGLLVSSAKSTWDETNDGVGEIAARIVLVDRALASYGPETRELRESLGRSAAAGVDRIWGAAAADSSAIESATASESVDDAVRALAPKTDAQQACRAEALARMAELRTKRWLLIERLHTGMPVALLVALDAWLAIFFASVGLLTPRNGTVTVALAVCGLCVASAVLVIMELSRPLDGLFKVSDEPLVNAIAHLGK